MLGQWNWVWPISPLWHEVFGKRFNLLWYNFLLLGKFSFAQIAKDWTNHPAIWLRRPLTFPTLNLFDLTIPVYISRKQWLVSNCRPLILNATALPCTALPFTNTILLFLTHTHTQLPTFSLSHTLKRTHTYYISNSESIFLVTPETKPRGTARKAGIRFKSKLKFAAKANISI